MTKILATVFFVVASLYYLYPTLQSYLLNQELEELPEEEAEAYYEENYDAFQNASTEALSLGLDLQGGMHVTLEVRTDALIAQLAGDAADETFYEVLDEARQVARAGDGSVINAFVDLFEERDAQARLSRYFRSDAAGITRRSSNEEVRQYLQAEADAAVGRAVEIIRDRVDRYGVTEPSIQTQGERRVVVELPGVDDAERVRRLLRGTARLEFRLMADPQQLTSALQDVIAYYETAEVEAEEATADTAGVATDAQLADADTTVADTTVADPFDVDELLAEEDPTTTGNPFLDVVQPIGQSVQFGLVAEQDTARARELLERPEVQALLPTGIDLLYYNRAQEGEDGTNYFYLLGVREETELSGEAITDASVAFDEVNRPEVSMTMNTEGARTWARITGANVGRPVAIVLDESVYSYPVVQNRIVGGRSSITGLGGRAEAQDIVTVLKSGALPAPVDIVEERTVGPSLGARSIRAGFLSVVAGLLAVIVFMVFYYRTAGFVADAALLLNILFIFGVLAAFNATLTLPGIAGIVLTIGMAVDANVLIFDRVREEQRAGRTLRAAIDGGYAKALSAIIDANITTFIVALILYSFGVGPIRGFAVTLMIGILASLFSAIVFTRILFDYFVDEKRKAVSFG